MDEAKMALRNILGYIGGLDEYVDNAQLLSYIEWAIQEADTDAE